MPQISLTKKYSFSAAHRLHSERLTVKQNMEVFDKCNNHYGHGHDYYVEVTVAGTPDIETGMLISLAELDNAVNGSLVTLEHKHLDLEIAHFKQNTSTGENIVQYLWQELNKRIPEDKLFHIRLWETNNNYFDMGKDTGWEA